MAYKATALTWFQTGDFPTQQQFNSVFNWLRWRDEEVPLASVTGLQDIINGLANPVQAYTVGVDASPSFTFKIPAGFLLEKVILEPPINCTVNLYDMDLAEVVIEPEEIISSRGAVWSVNMHAIADRNIRIETLPANTIITLIKRKVTL